MLQLQEITFKNYYTAFLSIRVRQYTSIHTQAKWVTCLRDHCLMPDPHSEEGAQEYVSLSKHQVSGDRAWPGGRLRACWAPENWAGIPGGVRGAGLSWAVALGEPPPRASVLSFPKAWEVAARLTARWEARGGERGSLGPCVCVPDAV